VKFDPEVWRIPPVAHGPSPSPEQKLNRVYGFMTYKDLLPAGTGTILYSLVILVKDARSKVVTTAPPVETRYNTVS
jgi:hypothetical protein